MLLCGGDQLLFGLYSVAILSLLVGGCLWGQGEDGGNEPKKIGGIVLFAIGFAVLIISIFVNVIKNLKNFTKSWKKSRQLKKEKTQIKDTELFRTNADLFPKSVIFVQPDLDLPDSDSNLSTKPIISRESQKSFRSMPCYFNPVFQPDNNHKVPHFILPVSSDIRTPNAAKNYTLSLYNAHIAGKI